MISSWTRLNQAGLPKVIRLGSGRFPSGRNVGVLNSISINAVRNYHPVLRPIAHRCYVQHRLLPVNRIGPFQNPAVHQVRQIGMIARVVRGALKIRYLVLGGAVGGGVTLQKVSTS